MNKDEYPLQFLLNLNLEITEKKAKGESVIPPGFPILNNINSEDYDQFITDDCVKI